MATLAATGADVNEDGLKKMRTRYNYVRTRIHTYVKYLCTVVGEKEWFALA